MIALPPLGASQASVTPDDVEAVIRRFVGAAGEDRSRAAAAVAGPISVDASSAGIAIRATRRAVIGCSPRTCAGSCGASQRYTAATPPRFVSARVGSKSDAPGPLPWRVARV